MGKIHKLYLTPNSMERIHPVETLDYTVHNVTKKVEIDIELVPLMKQIWAAGIHTQSSCQELPLDCAIVKIRNVGGYAWICFASDKDVKQFSKFIQNSTMKNLSLQRYGKYYGKDVYLTREFLKECNRNL